MLVEHFLNVQGRTQAASSMLQPCGYRSTPSLGRASAARAYDRQAGVPLQANCSWPHGRRHHVALESPRALPAACGLRHVHRSRFVFTHCAAAPSSCACRCCRGRVVGGVQEVHRQPHLPSAVTQSRDYVASCTTVRCNAARVTVGAQGEACIDREWFTKKCAV